MANSLRGLKLAAIHEAAFRQELVLALSLSVLALSLNLSPGLQLALLVGHVLVLVVELLNSAIEAVVDLASPEFHELAGRAKDMASAAVLLALGLSGMTWIYALYAFFGES